MEIDKRRGAELSGGGRKVELLTLEDFCNKLHSNSGHQGKILGFRLLVHRVASRLGHQDITAKEVESRGNLKSGWQGSKRKRKQSVWRKDVELTAARTIP